MSLDLVVAARNYRKTDAGLAFDMDTEMSADGQAGLARNLRVHVALAATRRSAPAAGRRGRRRRRRTASVLAELDVSSRTAWDYARVSGDFNPIHLNDRAARFFGLRGAISHGMWSLARSLAAKPEHDAASATRARDAVPDAGAVAGQGQRQGMDGGRRSRSARCATSAPDACTCTPTGRSD